MSRRYDELLAIRIDAKLLSFLDAAAEKKGLRTSSLARTILKKNLWMIL